MDSLAGESIGRDLWMVPMISFLAFSLNALWLATLQVPSHDELIQQLLDSDAGVRFRAFTEIERLGPGAKASVPTLMTIAKGDPSAFYRRKAYVALSRMGPDAAPAIPILIAALKDPDKGSPTESGIPLIAISVLANIGPQAASAVPALLEVVKKPQLEYMDQAAISALGRIGVADKEVLTVLEGALQHQARNTLRAQAAYAIGRLGPTRLGMHAKAILPLLLELIHLKGNIAGEDPDGIESARCAAAWALGQMGERADKKIVLAISAILFDQQATPAVRNAAIQALVKLGPKQANAALPTLVKALQSNRFDSVTIEDAVFSFGEAATPHLISLLKQESPAERSVFPLGRIAALNVLARIGPQMQKVTEAIDQLIREETANIRAPGAYEVIRVARKAHHTLNGRARQ